MKNFILIGTIIVAAVCVFISIDLFLRLEGLRSQMKNSERFIEEMKQSLTQFENQIETLKNEKEQIKQDAFSCLSAKQTFQKERDQLQESLASANKKIEIKDNDIKSYKEKITDFMQQKSSQSKLLEEMKALKVRNKELEKEQIKQSSVYHYNLAVVYTNSNLFDKAIEQYEKSLAYDDSNAEAHYNIAVLLEQQDEVKACRHYTKYLELKPLADDKDQVLKITQNLCSRW